MAQTIIKFNKQQNRIIMASRSLSPLSKDPSTVGKLVSKQQLSQLSNEHDHQEYQIRNFNPVDTNVNGSHNIGINTSKVNVSATNTSHNPQQQIKPVTQHNKGPQFKMSSEVYKIDLMNQKKKSGKKLNISSSKINKWARESGFFRKSSQKDRESEKSPVGTIYHQKKTVRTSRSTPRQSNSYSNTSPQLPSINKIDKNLNGFRSFIGDSHNTYINNNHSCMGLSHNSSKKQIGKTYLSTVFNKKLDPQENEKLQPKKGNRNSRFLKFPNSHEETHKEYEMQTSFEPRQCSPMNNTQDKMTSNESRIIQRNLQAFESESSEHEILHTSPVFEGSSRSYDYIYSQSSPSQSCFKIDLRTPISRIKQLLIESDDHLHPSFMIPQIFFHPPTHETSAKQLHHYMLEIFKHIDLTPQIVTIKKYVNCVMMCDKKLCILWSYNGKVYFGGWNKNHNIQGSQSRMLTQGNKHGIGMQWIPSKYIYYGEFRDNKKQGYGIMKKSNKQVYIGQWKANQREGWGKVFNLLGELVQDGQFIEGCFIRERERGRHEYD